MVTILSLWLPILLSAVLVFVASSIIHMLLPYHRTDFRKVPEEGRVMDALRPFAIAPGNYAMPHAATSAEMSDPAYQERARQGPVAILAVAENGPPAMGGALLKWFVYLIVVGIFVAYLTGRAMPAGAEYLEIFRFAGTVAFAGYALALWQSTIWYRVEWTTSLKNTFDGLVYALLTAGVFGWLWPG